MLLLSVFPHRILGVLNLKSQPSAVNQINDVGQLVTLGRVLTAFKKTVPQTPQLRLSIKIDE